MEKLIVEKKYNHKKLSKYLLDSIPNFSFNTFYKLLRKKDIKINGNRINHDIIINEGDEILVYVPNILKNQKPLDIIYEDENILLINKPANIEVLGNNSLKNIVDSIYQNSKFKPMPCHRLDRNTTGIILFAKNQESLNILLDKFKKHEIQKKYYALVYGVPKKSHAKLENYLFKDNKKSLVYISDSFKKGYSKIITNYTVLDIYNDNSCLLDVEIETGKTHQIRAHLAYIGYPIIGDGKYGSNDINKKFGVKYQQLQSYFIKFAFKTDAGILNYLNNRAFIIDNKLTII